MMSASNYVEYITVNTWWGVRVTFKRQKSSHSYTPTVRSSSRYERLFKQMCKDGRVTTIVPPERRGSKVIGHTTFITIKAPARQLATTPADAAEGAE